MPDFKTFVFPPDEARVGQLQAVITTVKQANPDASKPEIVKLVLLAAKDQGIYTVEGRELLRYEREVKHAFNIWRQANQ